MNPNICNSCGGDYEYRHGRWVCRACGSYKPEELSNEEVTLLYTASQKLRLADFDEAEQEFDDIVRKYPQNPHGYWGRLLSRYGIKYEEDFDGRMIPTCYATSMESMVEDSDYESALQYADEENRAYYTRQVEYMERVRKEWVDKASREKPYDIFISYKDSDLSNGIERTEDSVSAQEIYIHLLEQGYRVFFSRESLRDKVGEKYEPYIFNALSTAKVMLVYGSKPEYITSTWLKNEWHRFCKKIATGEKHPGALIVACDGFPPNKLPSVLSSKQCLDAKRKAFFSDLDRSIKKIIQESQPKASPTLKREPAVFTGPHEHSYRSTVIKATCISKGYTLHQCDCGYEYKDSFTDLVGHDFQVTDNVEPTCTEEGHTTNTCSVCGESNTTTSPALGHQLTKWVEGKRPTCEEDGESTRQCTRCGYSEAKALNKTGHRFGAWTDTQDGNQTSYCVNCGQTRTRDKAGTKRSVPLKTPGTELRKNSSKPVKRIATIIAVTVLLAAISVSAIFVLDVSKPSPPVYEPVETITVTDSTVTSVATEPVTDVATDVAEPDTTPSTEEVTVETETSGDAICAHEIVDDAAVPSTCTEAGLTRGTHCSKCGEVFMTQRQLEPISHTFVNGSTCSVCGKSLLVYNLASDNTYHLIACSDNNVSGNLVIPATYSGKPVTAIADRAFSNCSELSSVVIPDGVKSIGKYAFSSCYSLVQITLPSTLTSIAASAFEDSDGLYYVINQSALSLSAGSSQHGNVANYAKIIQNKNGSLSYASDATYKLTSDHFIYGKKNGKIFLYAYVGEGDTVTLPKTIDGQSYELNWFRTKASNVTVPEGITGLDACAFMGCANLASVHLPDSLTSIHSQAFQNCDSLRSINLPSNLKTIWNYAFSGCDSLTTIHIPASTTTLFFEAFTGCSSLSEIYVHPDNPVYKSIDNCLIESETKTLVLGIVNSKIPTDGSVLHIGESAFRGCSELKELVIPDGIQTIGAEAFYNCSRLKSIVIPDSVTSIGDSIFVNCFSFAHIYFTGTEEQWNAITKEPEWNGTSNSFKIHFDYQP